MFRRFTFLSIILILLSVSIHGQTVTISINPYGVTPYMVSLSTTDIYDYTYTGLHNVGVGTKVYLLATIHGKKFASPTYTISRLPSGSKAVMGTAKDIQNDSSQVVFFTPDLEGTYNVTLTDGAYSSTVVINSAKYLGYQNSVVNGTDMNVTCNTCHSSIVSSWSQTEHATMFTRAMNATPGLSGPNDHYSASCIKCHTTGYDANPTAKNDGFDDLTFVYPAVLTPTTFNDLVTKFPDAMKRANIQCESCHGPASGHVGVTTDFRMEATFDPVVCAWCHESGTNHVIAREFRVAGHDNTVNESGSGREACVRCHTGKGFMQFINNVPTTDPYFDASFTEISCAGCHDPHNATNDFQLRAASASLMTANNATLTVTKDIAGAGSVCFNCHQSRAEANASIAGAGTKAITSRFGPHHGPQGDILLGNNLLSLGGVALLKSNHIGATVNACVTCHMYNADILDVSNNNALILWGGHTFSMSTPDGKDHMAACAQCHGSTFGTSFDQAKFYLNGTGDFDGNGVVEGLQKEVSGMINKIMANLPLKKGQTTPVPDSTWSKVQISAFWNATTVTEDKSMGIHNPKYVVTALLGAMKSLGIATAVKSNNQDIPADYTLYQNYPNPFNPSTNIRFAIPKESYVKLTIYDITGREVQTLLNDQLAAGTHTIEWAPRNLASGIYLYRVEAGNFVKVNKMILLK